LGDGPFHLRDNYQQYQMFSTSNMKIQNLLLAITLLVSSAIGQQSIAQADRFMGDWQGSVTLNGQPQPAAVYMIPLGEGRYEARFVADFAVRSPYLFRLRGAIRGEQFRFMDDIPFDVGRVTGTTDQGVVLDASLWSGNLKDGAVQGMLSGRRRGRFELKQTQRVSPTLGKRPPADAVVLFDGSSLDAWESQNAGQPVKWKLGPAGAVEVAGGGNIISKEKFGNHQLHLEFCLPYMPREFGQARANSGVYFQSRYEVQVLDSYGLEGADNECGGIYQVARPLVNMCAPPLQWQTYDVTFHPAKLDAGGRKVANARITVIHNGVVIHDNLELPRVTGGAVNEQEGQPAGLMLQDHGNPVQYRNIWVERIQ
jgi:hypothetical protein